METLKIGLVSSSQLSFPGDKRTAFEYTGQRLKTLEHELGFSLSIYPEDVITAEHAHTAVKVLEAEQIDFVLLQCTSFSAGFLAPIFARIRNARLGLWAIPEFDSMPEGCLPFNSFCSINMFSGIIGHYLNDFEVPIKWFYGDIDNPLFIDRFSVTVRALKAIKKMQHSKVGLIGGIAPGFDDLYDDERKLVRLFDGLEIARLHEYDEVKSLAEAVSTDAAAERVRKLKEGAKAIAPEAESLLTVNARFSIAYEQFIAKYGYDAIAVSCWPKFQNDYRFSVCAVLAELNDQGIPAACEGDLTSAISMLLLKYISDDTPTLMDMSAFDIKDDSVLLWHCGPAAERFCQTSGYKLGLNYSGAPHKCAGHATGIGVVRDMVFDEGQATIARLTGECDTMFLAGGQLMPANKPSFCGSRGWFGRLSLNGEPIGALDFVNTILVQRMQHHFPIVYGDYSSEIMEVMAWLRLKQEERVPYKTNMQNPTYWTLPSKG